MNTRILLGFAFVSVAAFLTAIGLAYCAGWGHGPSFIGAELGGILVAFIGAAILILVLKIKAIFKRAAIYCAIFGVMIVFYHVAFDVMVRSFAAGVEKAVFSAASAAEWRSLVSIAQTQPFTNSIKSLDKVLPAFTARVYPAFGKPYSFVNSHIPDDLSDIHVVLLWHMFFPSVGMDIGTKAAKKGGFNKELYRKAYGDDMLVVIYRGE